MVLRLHQRLTPNPSSGFVENGRLLSETEIENKCTPNKVRQEQTTTEQNRSVDNSLSSDNGSHQSGDNEILAQISSFLGWGQMPKRPSPTPSKRLDKSERTSSLTQATLTPMGPPGSSRIEQLPAEMIELILVNLNLGDHRNIRLTSRTMASKSTQSRFRWYLQRKSIELNEEDLLHFIENTRPGGLGCHIEELVFAGLVDKGRARDYAEDYPLAAARKRTRTFARLYDSGRLLELMTEACLNLKRNTKKGKLESIQLQGVAEPADQFQRVCSIPTAYFWPQQGYMYPFDDIPSAAFASVCAAVFAVEIDVGGLWLHGQKESLQNMRLERKQVVRAQEYHEELRCRLERDEGLLGVGVERLSFTFAFDYLDQADASFR
ncbi:F-box domain protein [Acrodontium crateriforme]|uniref:F-box domain protein n=1 Tax=Acrodontium crateriforme TaxID=150365 RepID=A0AAQ3RD86_9PEZI|nr:F-box domain protein [Acrodontium crateriforme]